jgi:hypothetical protein
MPQSDRLLLLAGCHGVLRHHSIDSLAAYRSLHGEQLAYLHRFGSTIRRLVDQGDPDVLAALWPPADITWMVAMLTGDPTTRLLSVKRGPLGQAGGELLSLAYDVRDPDEERRAWRALRAALRGGS